MANNKGKKFEQIIKESFEKIPNVSVDRVHDQTTRYKGSTNVCDFIVYKKPHEYYIECKTVHGNTLPFSNITMGQWNGLLSKIRIKGVVAGIICWWVDKDVTRFIPIYTLAVMAMSGHKSIRYDCDADGIIDITGTKKRTYYTYDMDSFFHAVEERTRRSDI